MKKRNLLLVFTLFATIFAAKAQGEYGIKAGISYNSNGDYSEIINDTKQAIDDEGDSKSGFHVGVYGKYNLGPLYLRPELVYTKTKSEYNNGDLEISKLDVPVLVGFKVFGPLSAFVGPSFQYILDSEFENFNYDEVENDLTVGVNLGVGVEIGRLGIDARYERGFSENEASFINKNITETPEYRIDSRPEQFILSLSYRFSN
ncbi:outer membrane beta-barrel protein [Lutibacter sp. B1]|uniref:outer membrane beta-barrel protein n=1 Tax=Lutibacter sp. B1 TaxID=2725996 RepID=UPI0014562FAB|nr:outer membrane beta-barrel protein [Lutibacter sp. B1]NLP58296.1 PorT family protein [Lutibacter sp. B1]